jgi:hypothetical protein
VNEHEGSHLLGRFPQRQKLWLVIGPTVRGIVDHGSHQTQPVNRPVQFSDGRGGVLHRNLRQALETIGVVNGHLMYFVVAVAVHGRDRRGILIVVIKCRSRRDHMHIHTERVHVRKALFRSPDRPRRNTHRPWLNAVPCFPVLHGADETLRRQMSVNINAAHVYLRQFSMG